MSRPPHAEPARRDRHEVEQRLASSLRGATFPADRWELVILAETEGADLETRRMLARLPHGRYPDLAAVAAAIAGGPAVPATSAPTGSRLPGGR